MSTRSRTFIDAIRVLRYGALSDELTKELQRLVLACADTGRKGTLTLKLSIKPGKAGKLALWIDLLRPHEIVQHAVTEARKTIADGTGLPVLVGLPD